MPQQTAFSQNVATVLIGVVLIIVCVAAAWLTAIDRETPELLKFVGSGAVGALAGLAVGRDGGS